VSALADGTVLISNPVAGPVQPMMGVLCKNITMEAFAQTLRDHVSGNPVRNKTELKGPWDFDYKTSLGNGRGAAAGDAVTIFDALEKQLGLKLGSTKFHCRC